MSNSHINKPKSGVMKGWWWLVVVVGGDGGR